MTPAVTFRGVTRRFAEVRAVDGVSFEVADGEFFAMLGPSGSGKTTSLRLIAGFEEPDGGEILLHGRSTAGVPPYERPINTVFQDYALFPHLSVLDNVAYGLMVRGVPRAERHAKAEAMLALVALPGLGSRRPSQLSGGQRQRVALARALVLEPEVLLLDEPLGALDLKLRQQMQTELKALQRKVGITFIFVTHDQDEALGMADRVAVFNQGRIEQIGTPEEIYDRPATTFVAGFVGAANIVEAEAARRLTGENRAFALRPERIRLEAARDGEVGASGRVLVAHYHGSTTRLEVMLEQGPRLIVECPNSDGAVRLAAGQPVRLAWRREAMRPLA
jgi:putative spermidine/putrescine transport system ATP-binding protein